MGRRQLRLALAALMLGVLIASLDQLIVSTALPTIVGDLGGLNHIAWITTAYIPASSVVALLYGRLGDLIGRKPIYLFCIAVFTRARSCPARRTRWAS
jgi:MFS family permease